MFNATNCDQKSQFSGILTEPLNPRVHGKMTMPDLLLKALSDQE